MVVQQKTALITGAAQRLGRSLALGLAQEGYDIALHYHRSQEAALQTKRDIESLGRTVFLIQADLSDEGQVQNIFPHVLKALGPVSVLVNNAAVFAEGKTTALEVTEDQWSLHMAVNLRAPFVLSQAFAGSCPKGLKGHIINILDQRVFNLTPYFPAYTLSKTGLATLTQTLAMSFAPDIRVNAIAPGNIAPASDQPEDHFKERVSKTLLQSQVDDTQILKALLYLLEAEHVTGHHIPVDSGERLGWAQPKWPQRSDKK